MLWDRDHICCHKWRRVIVLLDLAQSFIAIGTHLYRVIHHAIIYMCAWFKSTWERQPKPKEIAWKKKEEVQYLTSVHHDKMVAITSSCKYLWLKVETSLGGHSLGMGTKNVAFNKPVCVWRAPRGCALLATKWNNVLWLKKAWHGKGWCYIFLLSVGFKLRRN